MALRNLRNGIVRVSFDYAIVLHQRGQIEEAEAAYRQILVAKPSHAGALHLLGVIRQQQGSHEDAVELIVRAITLMPTVAIYYSNYGAALLSLGRLSEAETSFDLNRSSPMKHTIR
jgi:Flp pilus assembly protein TadD